MSRRNVSETGSNEEAARPLHVVIFTPLGPGGQGGVDRMMDGLREALQLERFAKIKARFITTRGPGSILLSPVFLAQAIVRLLVLRLCGRVDVVHINLSAFGSTYRKLILARTSRMLRLPYVLHLHSGQFDDFWDSRKRILMRQIYLMFRRSQRIVVLGNYWKQIISDRMPDCRGKIVIVPNASRTANFEAPKFNGAANILFLGRLGPEKGVPQLVMALVSLGAKSGWTATLAGDGAVEDTRAAVQRAGLGDRVSVPGWIDSAGVEELLHVADILVLPSLSENLPMSVVEALGHGVAVICTPVGAIPDIIEHERTGLFVKPRDVDGLASALDRLIEDPELRRRLGAAGKALHEARLDIEVCTERLGAIWTESVCAEER